VKKLFSFSFSTKTNLILVIATALLLGASYPPFETGVFAAVGFVPFLLLIERIDSYGRFFRYSYATFFLFCLITLYWVGGFTHLKDPYLMIAGGALLLYQPLYFAVAASFYYFIRKRVHTDWAVAAFPFIWVTFEWLYAYGEFSFPWLTLGNTQTYQLEKIQFAEITGVYGISFWLLVINVLFFFLHRTINHGKKLSRNSILIATGIALIYLVPNFYSISVNKKALTSLSHSSLKIGIVQPNVDPWDKWAGANTFSGRWKQALHYIDLIKEYRNDSLDIAVLPESAILLNLPASLTEYREYKNFVDSTNIAIVSGYVKTEYYTKSDAPVSASKIAGTEMYYDSYNSIMFTQPHVEETQMYSKMRLVPLAERIPYAESVPFLIEPLRWGVGISNWGKGRDSTIFADKKTNTKFLAMICYESIFPEFVASFVNKGAQYLIFITNDSWWGNTSGARQHSQYAVLRAVENRRWVVRCANGGISCFIDPYGNMYQSTKMYETDFIAQNISPRNEQTFYSRHGDWFARICASVALLVFLFAIGYSFIRK
jgi:apolipoprotein N-acyltransferase